MSQAEPNQPNGDTRLTQEMIERRIQRRIESMTPAALLGLGKIYNSLRDGMGKPADFFEVTPTAAADADESVSQATRAKELLRARQAADEADKRPGRGQSTAKDKKPSNAQSGTGKAHAAHADTPAEAFAFFSEATAGEALRSSTTPEELAACWDAIMKDFSDTHRALPQGLMIQAVRACSTEAALIALWKTITSYCSEAQLATPLEVEAVYYERAEGLAEGAKKE